MRSEGPRPNFVFFDLSKLETASVLAFLSDTSLHQALERTGPQSCCHWILAHHRANELVTGLTLGSLWLQKRIQQGDRVLHTSPLDRDWNLLFPVEAEAELNAVTGAGADGLFLDQTAQAPLGMDPLSALVWRATSEGLEVGLEDARIVMPWASTDGRDRGVWWLVPGQILTSGLPPSPWRDLRDHLKTLTVRSERKEVPSVAPLTPRAKRLWSQVASQRAETGLGTGNSSYLFRSSEYPGLGDKEAVDFDQTLGGIRKRSLVANMQGQTDMKEQELRVRFRGGRLVRIDHSGSGQVLCSRAQSYLEWNGARHEFTVNSAFSFEGDFSWGLRQSLVLRHDDLAVEGRAILDYYFVEDSPELFVAVTVRWPRWKAPVRVQRWAVLELELFGPSKNAPLITRTLWPDGRAEELVRRTERQGVLAGTDFLLGSGPQALVVGFPQNQAPRPHRLPWKRTRRWGQSLLSVSPEGGWGEVQSTDLEGIEEHFTFYVAVAEGARLPFTVTRKQASELIPPYVIEVEE